MLCKLKTENYKIKCRFYILVMLLNNKQVIIKNYKLGNGFPTFNLHVMEIVCFKVIWKYFVFTLF